MKEAYLEQIKDNQTDVISVVAVKKSIKSVPKRNKDSTL